MRTQASTTDVPCRSFLHLRRHLALAAQLGIFLLFMQACNSNGPGPGCKVAPSGIADAPITGKTLLDKTLVFTFDRSPTPVTLEIADLLTARQINGAFFVVGKKLKDVVHQGILAHLRSNGHLIGNGTYSFANLEAVALPTAELRQVDQMIQPDVVGNMFFFRSAANSFNHKIADYLNKQGLQKYVGPIGSDIVFTGGVDPIDAGCWNEVLTPADCAQRYIDAINLKQQGIIRFTDGYSQTPALLQALIPLVTSAGYKVVRLDEVPEIRTAFLEREAVPGTVGGSPGCKDYDRR